MIALSVLMLFLDGVGLGKPDPGVNPFFTSEIPALTSLFGGNRPSLENMRLRTPISTCLPLDATLGIDGLPQSGTGQTTLFTGLNASKLIGKHFGPYPYSSLRPVIVRQNIFRTFLDRGKRPLFANAFPRRYFDYVGKHPGRMTVPPMSSTSCNIPLLTTEDLLNGKAISADITSQGWKQLGHPEVEAISPGEAGRRIVSFLEENDFVAFEYWMTDKAGHSQDFNQAKESLERLDGMLQGVLASMDYGKHLLLISSDHGNLEDLSTKSHTRNPVPLILAGQHHSDFADYVSSLATVPDLTCVVPALKHFFQ